MLQPSPESVSRAGSYHFVLVRDGKKGRTADCPAIALMIPSSHKEGLTDERHIETLLGTLGIFATIDLSLGFAGDIRGFLYRTYRQNEGIDPQSWPPARALEQITLNEHLLEISQDQIIELVKRAFSR